MAGAAVPSAGADETAPGGVPAMVRGVEIRDEASIRSAEHRIAAAYSGDFAWGSVAWAAVALSGYAGVIALALDGVLPLLVACPLNALFAYAAFMPQHEAIHGNIAGRNRRLRFLDTLLGWACSFTLTLTFPGIRIMHLLHHSYTNDPARDPDLYIAGPFRVVPVKWLFLLASALLPFLPALVRARADALADGSRMQRASQIMRRGNLANLGLLVGATALGYGAEAFLLWFLPGSLALLLLMVIFQWLPHHPHAERGRYRDTRVTLFPGSTWLLMFHDHHLIHHMFPRIPHYRFRKVFRELLPILERQGARIQRFGV